MNIPLAILPPLQGQLDACALESLSFLLHNSPNTNTHLSTSCVMSTLQSSAIKDRMQVHSTRDHVFFYSSFRAVQ
jgi:hypothetical protein